MAVTKISDLPPYSVGGLLGGINPQNAHGWYDFERRQREELYQQSGVAQYVNNPSQNAPTVSKTADNELLLLLDD